MIIISKANDRKFNYYELDDQEDNDKDEEAQPSNKKRILIGSLCAVTGILLIYGIKWIKPSEDVIDGDYNNLYPRSNAGFSPIYGKQSRHQLGGFGNTNSDMSRFNSQSQLIRSPKTETPFLYKHEDIGTEMRSIGKINISNVKVNDEVYNNFIKYYDRHYGSFMKKVSDNIAEYSQSQYNKILIPKSFQTLHDIETALSEKPYPIEKCNMEDYKLKYITNNIIIDNLSRLSERYSSYTDEAMKMIRMSKKDIANWQIDYEEDIQSSMDQIGDLHIQMFLKQIYKTAGASHVILAARCIEKILSLDNQSDICAVLDTLSADLTELKTRLHNYMKNDLIGQYMYFISIDAKRKLDNTINQGDRLLIFMQYYIAQKYIYQYVYDIVERWEEDQVHSAIKEPSMFTAQRANIFQSFINSIDNK